MDRISELPDSILHSILSLLPTRDVVRTRVLSRRWNCLLDSFPFWDFDQRYFPWSRQSPQNCVDFARRSLGSLTRDGIGTPKIKFYLSPHISLISGVYRSLSDCIDMAVDGQVKELNLDVSQSKVIYAVPRSIFACRNLTILELRGCSFGESVPARKVGNPTLRKLSLFGVRVCEAELRLLFDCFPSVEDLSIKDCFPVSRISVSGFPKLKFLDVKSNTVEIDAPSLQRLRLENAFVDDNIVESITAKCPVMEDFALVSPRGSDRLTIQGFFDVDSLDLYRGLDSKGEIDVKVRGLRNFRFHCSPKALSLITLGIDVCRRLKMMEISGVPIDPDHLRNGFFYRFPLLEKLHISRCRTVMRIDISSPRLKSIYLGDSRALDDIRIEAPQLHSFHYMGTQAPLSFSVRVPCPLELMLKPVCKFSRDDSFFLRLNALLSRLDRTAEIKISILSYNTFPVIDIHELRRRCVFPSRNLDKLCIAVGGRGSCDFPLLVDALLWSCRPTSLCICPGFPKEFMKVLYEKITGPNLWNVEMKTLSPSSKCGKLRWWNLDTEWELLPPLETFAGLLRNFHGREAHFGLHWPDPSGHSG